MLRQVVIVALVLAVMATPPAAAQMSAPEDGLKVVHRTLLSGISSGNPALVEPLLDQLGVGFFRESQMVVQLGGSYGRREAIPAVLADLSRFNMTTYETIYRVAGTTGVVCMAGRMEPRKGEKGGARYVRSTWVYTLIDGSWRLVSWHSSDVPLKK